MSLFRKIRWATSEAMLFVRAVVNLPLGFLGAIAYIDQQSKKNGESGIMTDKTANYVALAILGWALLSYIDLKFKEHEQHQKTLDRKTIQAHMVNFIEDSALQKDIKTLFYLEILKDGTHQQRQAGIEALENLENSTTTDQNDLGRQFKNILTDFFRKKPHKKQGALLSEPSLV